MIDPLLAAMTAEDADGDLIIFEDAEEDAMTGLGEREVLEDEARDEEEAGFARFDLELDAEGRFVG